MLDYLPIFPELMEALEEFDDAAVGRLLRAASVYAFTGTEPDFPAGSPERFAWRFIRQRVDAAALKREKKAAAGKLGGRPEKSDESTEKQTKADESTEKQTKASETLQEQSQSQDQAQEQSQGNPMETNTHKDPRQGDSAGARAGERETVPAGWYDPEQPDRPCDASWLGSPQARKSIAQRILDHVIRRRIITPGAVTAESGRTMGREIMDALQAAMAAGKSPGECQKLAQDARDLWVWEIRLKEIALAYGTAPPAMADLWKQDVAELSAEAEDVALYG